MKRIYNREKTKKIIIIQCLLHFNGWPFIFFLYKEINVHIYMVACLYCKSERNNREENDIFLLHYG